MVANDPSLVETDFGIQPLLELAGSELQHLASIFGIARLPLPDIRPADHLQSTQLSGQQSLEQRGLLQDHGIHSQLDPAAALVIQWMMNAEAKWQYRYMERTGSVSYSLLYSLKNRFLLAATTTPSGYQFAACSNLSYALQEWQGKAGQIDLVSTCDQPIWDIPQPLVVIRSCWKNQQLASQMADTSFLTWAERVHSVGEWSLWTNKATVSRVTLAYHQDGLWAGSFVPNRPGECILRPVSPVMLMTILMKSLGAEIDRSYSNT